MSDILQTIEIPLFDVKDQRIIERKSYKVDLYKDYLRYELYFKSNETDEVELAKRIEETSDELLKNILQADDLPTKNVSRKEVSYIDRLAIVAIDFSRSSENEFGILTITARDYDERFFYKESAKGIEFLEILKKWRWS